MNEDRRQFRRIPFEHSVTLDLPGGERVCQLIDLSLKGALITCDGPLGLDKGGRCRLVIQLDGSEVSISTQAQLVYIEQDQHGFRFGEIGLDSLTHLRRLVELNLGDDEEIKKELFFIVDQH